MCVFGVLVVVVLGNNTAVGLVVSVLVGTIFVLYVSLVVLGADVLVLVVSIVVLVVSLVWNVRH